MQGPRGGQDRTGLADARLWVAQELVKHTQDAMEKENLRLALDAMRVRGHTGVGDGRTVTPWASAPPRRSDTPVCSTPLAHRGTLWAPSVCPLGWVRYPD